MQASKDFIEAQSKGQFVPSDLRRNLVKDVKNAHFSLGSEPVVKQTSSQEEPVHI